MALPSSSPQKGISSSVRTIVTILLLLLTLFSPLIGLIGIIIMWCWATWPKWVKVLVTVPFALFFALLLLSTVGVLSYLFVGRPFQVTGVGMAPNYNNGAYLMTGVVSKDVKLARGDVVIFKAPQNGWEFIGRVAGLPGENILLRAGELYINGQRLDEGKYLSPGVQTSEGAFLKEGQTLAIPPDQYFVLGDNRPHGTDSRKWGFVPRVNILGKVLFCYWNCGKK